MMCLSFYRGTMAGSRLNKWKDARSFYLALVEKEETASKFDQEF